MTNIEIRFMERVPNLLARIADALEGKSTTTIEPAQADDRLPQDIIQQAFLTLSDEDQVSVLAFLYNSRLSCAQKDEFLRKTGNE